MNHQGLRVINEENALRSCELLITGFEAFGGRESNASAQLVERLAERHGLVAVIFPVVWQGHLERLENVVELWRPQAIVGFGESSQDLIQVEMLARNEARGEDVEGCSPAAAVLDAVGPARRHQTYFASPFWPTESQISAQEKEGAHRQICISHDAGTYLCNAHFFYSLGMGLSRVGFIHIPKLELLRSETDLQEIFEQVEGILLDPNVL